MSNQNSKFGPGFILTALIGLLAGLFLSERPGKQLRQKTKTEYDNLKKLIEENDIDEAVKEIFGKVTTESKQAYLITKKYLTENLTNIKQDLSTIDKEKYKKLVNQTVDKVKEDKKIPDDVLGKLAKYIKADYKKIKTPRKVNKQKKLTRKTSKKKTT